MRKTTIAIALMALHTMTAAVPAEAGPKRLAPQDAGQPAVATVNDESGTRIAIICDDLSRVATRVDVGGTLYHNDLVTGLSVLPSGPASQLRLASYRGVEIPHLPTGSIGADFAAYGSTQQLAAASGTACGSSIVAPVPRRPGAPRPV